MVTENSLQTNQGVYGKSVQNSFISWLKNPSNLQKKVKQVISQTLDNQEVVYSHLNNLINSALTPVNIFATLCDEPLNQLEFRGGLASARY